jgi:hypothetical protein
MKNMMKALMLAGLVLGALAWPAAAKPGDNLCDANSQDPACINPKEPGVLPPSDGPVIVPQPGNPPPQVNSGGTPPSGFDWKHRRHRPGTGNWGNNGWHGHNWNDAPQFYFNLQLEPRYEQFSYTTRCDRLANSLRRSGFRQVRALSCAGRIYLYSAYRDGERLRISINRNTGRVLRIRPIGY